MTADRGRGVDGSSDGSPDAHERPTATDTLRTTRRSLLATAGTALAGSVAAGVAGATRDSRRDVVDAIDGAPSALPSPDHPLDASPGSNFAPHDGFAAAEWFDDSVDVYRVTTLDSSGPGSLRRAVEQSGPRLVVFEVSGTIDLDEDRLTVEHDNCWIAGQTAPSPGITLVRADLRVDASDCVVQHIRVRPGDAGNDSGWEPDGLRTSDDTVNNIVDHCSVSWSVDEIVSPGYNATDTTFSNCIAAEPLHDSTHPKGPHGYGMLVGDGSTGNTIVGNLFTHNVRRNVRLKSESEAVVANNIFDDYDAGTNTDEAGQFSIEGNGYQRGEDDPRLIEGGAKGDQQATAYLADNWATFDAELTNGQLNRVDSRPIWPDGLAALRPGSVRSHDTVHAGARPADRTVHDERAVSDVRNATGGVVDSQSEVGGYPDLAENTRELDVPDENLGDWLYAHTRAVEPDVSDYATDSGAVRTSGLRSALSDWRSDEIDTPLLRDVIAAW
jgi:hypothetical protein